MRQRLSRRSRGLTKRRSISFNALIIASFSACLCRCRLSTTPSSSRWHGLKYHASATGWMSQLILTVHTGIHDAAAAVFEDYSLRAAVQLERLTRHKGDGRHYPDLCIDEVLA